ncbi:hypothetical protein M3601_19195, partial [Bacillus altitudinis]
MPYRFAVVPLFCRFYRCAWTRLITPMAAAPRFADKQTEDRHHDAEKPRDQIPTVYARQPAR